MQNTTRVFCAIVVVVLGLAGPVSAEDTPSAQAAGITAVAQIAQKEADQAQNAANEAREAAGRNDLDAASAADSKAMVASKQANGSADAAMTACAGMRNAHCGPDARDDADMKMPT